MLSVLLQCFLEIGPFFLELTTDVDDRLLGLHGERCDGDALDEQIGSAQHHVAVLECAGFALIGIAHEVTLRFLLGAHGSPLDVGREGGTATTLQSRGLELVQQSFTTHRASASQSCERHFRDAAEIDRQVRIVREDAALPSAVGHQGEILGQRYRRPIALAEAAHARVGLPQVAELVAHFGRSGETAGKTPAYTDPGRLATEQRIEVPCAPDTCLGDACCSGHAGHARLVGAPFQ